ncbi:MAG: nucleotide sugar dehydrogenase [Fimbriimonadaceae bacterium]|nr:nucleotide sugar dehydrogenase [Fimbriimonadaceae bacterium]
MRGSLSRSCTPPPLGVRRVEHRTALLQQIADRSLRVGVIGLGYVGLPLAAEFASAGLTVVGFDVDATKTAALNRGESYIDDVPAATVADLVATGRLSGTTDFSALATVDAVSICVPTPLRKTKDPNISYVVAAADVVAQHARPGLLVVLESTTYPGTTTEILVPRLQERGLTVGRDVFVAFSPERVDPGNQTWTTHNTPKVMGGCTPACLEVATALYQTAVESIVPVSSPAAAEMVKLLENTFRAVNIGLVNEIAIICDHLGLDVWEIINAAATKPFGYTRFTPGPGLGGHCIPIDPLYLSWKLRALDYEARFIALADTINSNMPRHVVSKIADALNGQGKAIRGSRILLLGVAYKPNVADIRESPALDILELLEERAAELFYHDPYVPEVRAEGHHWQRSELTEPLLRAVDCVVVVTDHRAYDWDWIRRHARLLVDTRNALAATSAGGTVVKL